MAVDPAGPVMSREEVDRALARLGAERDSVESALSALQDHSGRRLLEGADLSGVTEERWAAAGEAVSGLWAHFEAWDAALARAREVRGRRSRPSREELAELTELLRGSGVTVPGGPGRTAECTGLEVLAERMNEQYARAMAVVTAAEAVWSSLPARIDLLTAELRRVRSLAHALGMHPGGHPAADGLDELADELARMRGEALRDPLRFWRPLPSGGGRVAVGGYGRAERRLEEIRREVETVMHVREDADQRLLRVRDVLSRADRTLNEARAARGEVLAGIAAVEVPAVTGAPAALHRQLVTASEYRRDGQWHRLSPVLDRLEEEADAELVRARESLAAVTEPLAVRARLRGELDSCRARVNRFGYDGDPELVEHHDRARRLLWSAPCDLRAAERAVRRYRQAAAELLPADRGGPAGPRAGFRKDTGPRDGARR
ncbi:hypothetical protein ACFW9F_07225 [Streptomyces sp. NPDC059506]|uniref:hypothetical protein n=1 Tax=Streptomyces sp. NPDC059506 TaxID=3347751 RepID=UPI003691607E